MNILFNGSSLIYIFGKVHSESEYSDPLQVGPTQMCTFKRTPVFRPEKYIWWQKSTHFGKVSV